MPMRTVLGFVAYVADTGEGKPAILKGAQGKVYSVNDVGLTTPLACRDLATEAVIPNPVSNEDGFILPFKVSISDTASGILWVSGEYPIYQPFLGVKGEKGNKGDTGGISQAQMDAATTAAKNAAIADATTKYGSLPARLTKLDGQGQRGYTIDQSVGRTVKVWDYLNNREQMIYGDTGWRKIAPEAGWSGNVYIRRIGGNAQILCDGASAAAAPAGTFLILPSGFRAGAPSGVSERFLLHNSSSAGRRGYISLNGVTLANYSAGEALYGSADFPTNDPWPTALPGVAA